MDDIIYSDDIHGPLMTQVDRAMEFIHLYKVPESAEKAAWSWNVGHAGFI